ncbi:MAG: penicillin-binding protein activator [Pseudomonadota bacterium]
MLNGVASLLVKLRLMLLGGVVALLAACDPAIIQAPPSLTRSSEPVTVALLVPSSSPNAGDAVVAQSLENAARLAISDLEGVEVKLLILDSGGNGIQASAAAAEAVQAGARVILGPLFSEAANAVGVTLQRTNVPVLAFSNNTSIAGGNVLTLGNTFENASRRLLSYASSQGRSRIFVAHADNIAGDAANRAITKAAGANATAVVGSVAYPFSQEGVFDAARQVADGARASGADSVMLTSDAAGALPLFAQLLPERGLTPGTVQYMGLTRWDIPQIMSLPALQGGWFPLQDPGRVSAFSRRYQDAYGSAPHPLAGLAYDGIAAIGALRAQGLAVNGANLRQSAGFQGTGGAFRFLPDGTIERSLAVATIEAGAVRIVDPAPQGFGGGAGF